MATTAGGWVGISRVGAGTAEGDWVEAGPFRAHLRHLMAVGALDEHEVATVAGLSARAVGHILHGRAGRVQRRISPDTARRLLGVRTEDMAGLRWCLTPAGPARTAYRRLRASGWDETAVAARVRVPVAELTALADDPRCSRLLTVRLVSLLGRAGLARDGDPDEVRRAA